MKGAAVLLPLLLLTLLSADPAPLDREALARIELDGTEHGARRLGDYRGRVVVLFYEDRDSASQNELLKQEMSARAQEAGLARQVVLLPIANLEAFDFWPARPIARGHVVDIARRFGIEILIDWSGATAQAWGFAKRQSHVLVLDGEGRPLFRESGPLDGAARGRFFAVLGQAVGRG